MVDNPFRNLKKPKPKAEAETKELAIAPAIPATQGTYKPTENQLKALAVKIEKAPETQGELEQLCGIGPGRFSKWKANPEFKRWWSRELWAAMGEENINMLPVIVSNILKRAADPTADVDVIRLAIGELQKLMGTVEADSGASAHITLVLPQGEDLPSPSTLLVEEIVDATWTEVKDE